MESLAQQAGLFCFKAVLRGIGGLFDGVLLDETNQRGSRLAPCNPANAGAGDGREPKARDAHDYGEPNKLFSGHPLCNSAKYLP